jgi:putative acetyltransferase
MKTLIKEPLIKRTNSENNDFKNLTQMLDADLNSRYGSLQSEYNKYNKIELIETLVIAYDNEIPIGCGCFKYFETNTVEIKRMFVLPEYRGKGIASSILSELEYWATEKGFNRTVLETGSKQHEAISFYTKLGYNRTANYGQYAGNSNSICLSKELKMEH